MSSQETWLMRMCHGKVGKSINLIKLIRILAIKIVKNAIEISIRRKIQWCQNQEEIQKKACLTTASNAFRWKHNQGKQLKLSMFKTVEKIVQLKHKTKEHKVQVIKEIHSKEHKVQAIKETNSKKHKVQAIKEIHSKKQ